jgi:hypothetical protein
MDNFPDIITGAKALLFDTCQTINQLGYKYIIVGGWTTFLLNSSDICHPGTKDVDILFDKGYEKGSLKKVIEALLENGFILSAKHDFQLFKEIQVASHRLIYNVDLLHPLETVNPKEIYVEQVDLGIPADKYQSATFKMKSIVLPSSQALFDLNLVTPYQLSLSTGKGAIHVQVPLMSELGTLITKSQSVKQPKRFRDAFDIFLTVHQSADIDKLVSEVEKLKSKNIGTYNTLYGIREAFEEEIMYANTIKFHDIKKELFDRTMQNFLEKTGLIKKAKN